MEIISQGCQTENGGLTGAQAAIIFQYQGYDDWYLPSIDELKRMKATIGPGSPLGNVGGFETNFELLTWYWSSTAFTDHSISLSGVPSEYEYIYNYVKFDCENYDDLYGFVGCSQGSSYATNPMRVRPIRSF